MVARRRAAVKDEAGAAAWYQGRPATSLPDVVLRQCQFNGHSRTGVWRSAVFTERAGDDRRRHSSKWAREV
jgi:hypothetical protein